MRKSVLMPLLVCAALSPAGARAFDPAVDAIVLVNLSVPQRTEAGVRLQLDSATLRSAELSFAGASGFVQLDAERLAGRAPRWIRTEVVPGILDSLVLRWEHFAVEVDGAWTYPEVGAPTVIALHRTVARGEALVLNLRWAPEATSPDDPAWAPEFELEEIAEPPQGGRIYVSEEGEGIVSVFERVGGRMVRALAVGGQPRDLDFDDLQQRLYVALGGRDELAVIDVAGRETVRRLPLSFGADPTRLLLTRDRQRVAVVAPGRDVVFLYSTSSLQEVARVRVGQDPVAIAEAAEGGRLFVTCRTAGEIHVIDPGSGRSLDRFDGFESPTELVILESGLLAVGQDRVNRIDLVDPNSGGVQSSLRICGATTGLLEVPRTERLYVLDQRCSEFTIFQPSTGLELGSIPLDEPAGLPTLTPRGAELLVPFPRSGQVALLAVDRGDRKLVLDAGSGVWRAIAP